MEDIGNIYETRGKERKNIARSLYQDTKNLFFQKGSELEEKFTELCVGDQVRFLESIEDALKFAHGFRKEVREIEKWTDEIYCEGKMPYDLQD